MLAERVEFDVADLGHVAGKDRKLLADPLDHGLEPAVEAAGFAIGEHLEVDVILSQRPAKRGGRSEAAVGLIERLRTFARYLPLVGKFALLLIAGGLVFAGSLDRVFSAYDAATGKGFGRHA